MDARTDIKSALPNMFEAVGKQSVGGMPDADLEPATSPSAIVRGVQFIAGVATVSEAVGPALPDPTDTLAAARERDLGFDRFEAAEIFKKTPHIADLKPGGRDVAKDRFDAGGISLLMKTLLDNGHLYGNCFTVPGRITENLKSASWNPRQDVGRSVDRPVTAAGGVIGLKQNLAPDMAVVKVERMSNLKFTGAVRYFDREDAARGPCDGRTGAAVGTLNVKLTDAELADRKTKWRRRATNHTSDTLSKYAEQVRPAAGGAVTRPGGAYEKQCYVDI
ncbi:MAG: dihydroxy-acid dehydratase [Bradyrhizobium sp.]|nr:dihydroxy-acid dehydratase [Bradyrhizobium sp.]MBU6463956.1 dihydroxy-acid dehydratase [Pseudomonadota bacterium]MDE2067108.1 dihydroxy-acid dehydratase [Bradyrhizobium sp.]MDE2243154.1 dihydroxy-acid dehydratase [Bradyrhizobium sp.]